MNVTKISAIAEIVSSVAIVVTLVYLTIETSQNTEALHATSRQTTMEADLAFLSKAMDYPEIALGLGGGNTTAEDIRISAYLVSYLRIREFAWFQYQNGILDEATWESYMAPTALIFSSERARHFWESGEFKADPEFIAYVDQFLAENVDGQ